MITEPALTEQWIATAHRAQLSMERLGTLADRFRRKGWTEAAEELEKALREIQQHAADAIR